MKVLPLAFVLAATLTACVSVPKPLQGTFSPLTPEAAARGQVSGELVRWGGHIVSVVPGRGHSCFEIVAVPLGDSGRPRDVDQSLGRFIACRAGFYEPEVFEEGREVTISGRIDGFEMRKVGDYDYSYPRVAADVVYLWPVQRPEHYYNAYPYGPWYGPWYGGWYGGWGRRW